MSLVSLVTLYIPLFCEPLLLQDCFLFHCFCWCLLCRLPCVFALCLVFWIFVFERIKLHLDVLFCPRDSVTIYFYMVRESLMKVYIC